MIKDKIQSCERLLDKLGGLLSGPFLFAIRLYWGWQFFMAGKGKFGNMDHVAGFFESLSIPLPLASAYLVAIVETVGGLLLLLGLKSRLGAAPLALTMVVAYLTAHRDAVVGIFSDPDLFFAQDPFLFLMMTVIVLCFGAGKFSLDYFLNKKRQS